MENIEKIASFEEIITKESEAKAKSIISAAEARAKEAVSSADKVYVDKVYNYVSTETKNIKRKYSKLVSQKEFEASKTVFVHRNQAVEAFFEDMAKEISDFSKTPEYRQDLAKLLSEIEEENGFASDAVAYVKAEDVDAVKKLYPSLNVKADKKIKLGGVTVFYPNKSIYIDKTFDSAFEQQKEEFVNNGLIQL